MEIAVSTYSLRHYIKEKEWSFEKIAEELKKRDIKYVEINNIFTTPENFPRAVKIFEKEGIKTILLTIDGNNYFQRFSFLKKKQFHFMKEWIDAAERSSVSLIRANMGHTSQKNKEKALNQIISTFIPILEYCKEKGIVHVFENHGGLSSDVDFQLLFYQKLKELGLERYSGFLLDTGNYKPKNLIYDNILKLKDSIKIVHAKTYNFNEEREETQLDFSRIIENLKTIGFDGYLSIEYEGKEDDLVGIDKTITLLKKYI